MPPREHYAHRRGSPPWQLSDWALETSVAQWHARRRMSARSRLIVPAVLSFIVQVPAIFFIWTQGTHPAVHEWDGSPILWIRLGIALVGPVALLFARRYPGPVVAIVAVAASADLLVAGDTDGPPYIAFAFAIGSAILRGARVWAWASIVVSWIGTLTVGAILGLQWRPWRVVGISIGILFVVGVAEFTLTRRQRMEDISRTISTRRQSEVQAERVRIARELHDVLAHSLSQINVQAGVGLHLIDKQPGQAADALASIKETSKTALDEVRSVLGILRAEDGADPSAPLVPEPDLSRLEGLAASVTSQGVEVELDNRLGEVPKATQLAIYRIVQESLTNAVRHSGARHARVTLAETDAAYAIEVNDDGTQQPAASASGGRGILGMRERAELLGGELAAGPRAGGGFAVTATIPRQEAP